MPSDAVKTTSPSGSKGGSVSSTPARSGTPAGPATAFQLYEVNDDDVRTPSTPEPIKVKSKKKKKPKIAGA